MIVAALGMTAALLGWKAEIEKTGGVVVEVAEVEYDATGNEFRLRVETPRRAQFVKYLKNESFVRQFAQMYGVMVHHKEEGGGGAYLVMLNGKKRREWAGHEEALVGHELGHAWIKAQGYATPVFIDNAWACVGVHAGDITQHVLIREEMDRRGIGWRKFWLAGLEAAVGELETRPAPEEKDRCARLKAAAQWVDVKLGMKTGEWANAGRYEAALKKWMPEVEETVSEVVDYMRRKNMGDRDEHREALKFVFEKLKDLGYQRTKAYRVYVTLKGNPHVS